MTFARIGRRGALAGATALFAAPAIVRAQGAQGVALVIGNSKYHWEAPLPNVKRDAPDIAKRFQAMGLRTTLVEDAGGAAMSQFSVWDGGPNGYNGEQNLASVLQYLGVVDSFLVPNVC